MIAVFCAASALLVGSPASPRGRITDSVSTSRLLYLAGLIPAAIVLAKGAAVAISALMVTGLLVWKLTSMYRRARVREAGEDTANLVGSLVSDLRAGATPHEAMKHAAMDSPERLRELCTVAAHRSSAGVSPAVVLIDAPEPYGDLRDVGKLWSVADSRGIALAGLLEHMQHRIDTRLRHARATQAALQGPQATAVILSSLPLAGIGMGIAMGADPVGFLTGTPLGGMLLAVGTALGCAGFLWVDRIVDSAINDGGA